MPIADLLKSRDGGGNVAGPDDDVNVEYKAGDPK